MTFDFQSLLTPDKLVTAYEDYSHIDMASENILMDYGKESDPVIRSELEDAYWRCEDVYESRALEIKLEKARREDGRTH